MSQIAYRCRVHGTAKEFYSGHYRCTECRRDLEARQLAKARALPCKKCKQPRTEVKCGDGAIRVICVPCVRAAYANRAPATNCALHKGGYAAWEEAIQAHEELHRLIAIECRLEQAKDDQMRFHDRREATRREWEVKAREARKGAVRA